MCVCARMCVFFQFFPEENWQSRESTRGFRKAEDNQLIRASGPGRQKNVLTVYKRKKNTEIE